MTTMTHPPQTRARVFGGVDTHKDVHVAAALDELGRLLGTGSFPTTAAGYRQLWQWLRSYGEVVAVGVEGTGSWGAGLARHLTAAGVDVREVMRPNRQHRRRYGKSDEADAIGAARAVLAGEAVGTPKSQTGQVEAIRLLRVARRSAMKARTQAGNQIHAVIDTAPSSCAAASSAEPTDDDRRRGGPVPSPPRPDHAARGRPAHAAHPGSPLGVPRRRARRARRPARRAHRRTSRRRCGRSTVSAPRSPPPCSPPPATTPTGCAHRRRSPRCAASHRSTPHPAVNNTTASTATATATPTGRSTSSSSAGSAGTHRPRPTWPDDSPKDAPTR